MIYYLQIFFLLLFPQILLVPASFRQGNAAELLPSLKASSHAEIEEVRIPLSEYQYQNALYLYLTGDYLSSSILSSNIINNPSKIKDKAILLLKQSDINRLSKMREYPMFSFQSFPKEISERVKLLDVIYEMSEYERLFLSKELDNLETANYFEGISLLRLNRLTDSKRLLLQISRDNKLYPYARISIAQIEVMKQNYEEAENILRDILNHPVIEKENLSERIHLLLGQVLFEMGSYSNALNEFLSVSQKSQFYREAIIGQAWSLIKLGYYENAIPILKVIKPLPPYNHEDQEIQIVLGYCYLKTGMIKEAAEHFQFLSNVYSETEGRLKQIISDKTIRRQYISNLIERNSVSLSDEERYYLSELHRNPNLSDIVEEYKLLNILRNGFLRKKEKVINKEIYVDNIIRWMEDMQRKIGEDIEYVKNSLLTISGTEGKNKEILLLKGVEIAKNQILNDYWQKTVKHQMTETEKKIVEAILHEAVEGMGCLDSPVTCPIYSHVIDRGVKMVKYDKLEDLKRIVLVIEKFGRDIDKIKKKDKIEFENALSRVMPIFEKRIGKGREDLKELGMIKERLNKDIIDTERALDETMNRLDNHVAERLAKIKFELADFKGDIIAGMDSAKMSAEKAAKDKGK
ncbi:MAG: hypothetical protein HY096_04430 [Nitrospinae bacterium]|nr:hypothetical protein [Nitrospinota bacterium]